MKTAQQRLKEIDWETEALRKERDELVAQMFSQHPFKAGDKVCVTYLPDGERTKTKTETCFISSIYFREGEVKYHFRKMKADGTQSTRHFLRYRWEGKFMYLTPA